MQQAPRDNKTCSLKTCKNGLSNQFADFFLLQQISCGFVLGFVIILNIKDQFEILERLQSDNRGNKICFKEMGSTFHTLFGAISKEIELQSCNWSRIVDNLT